MKVAYAKTSFYFGLKSGGAVGHTLGVLKGLQNNNCDIQIVTVEEFWGIENYDYKLIKPRTTRYLSEIAYNFYARSKYKKEFENFKPDFIYHRYTSFTYFITAVAKTLNIPMVLEFNSFSTWKIRHWNLAKNFIIAFIEKYIIYYIMKFVENYNLRHASLIVVVSQPLKDDLLKIGIPEKKIMVNPNGVNLYKFNPTIKDYESSMKIKKRMNLTNQDFIVGFSGTYGNWHGIPELTTAITKILDKKLIPNVHFLLLGHGTLQKQMKERLMQYPQVTFTGEVPYSDIQNYLGVCDVLVSPHNKPVDGREFFGSPTKIFEYMAMGKGIVASNLGQIGKVLQHEHNALLVEPGMVNELVSSIIRLSNNSKLAKKLGHQAFQDVSKKYTWDNNVRRLLDTLKEESLIR